MPSSLGRRLRAFLMIAAVAAMTSASVAPAEAARARTPRGDELKRSWGLAAIGAPAAYRAGFTGRGVTIALVDCGVRSAQRELMRNISRRSADVVGGRVQADLEPHGTWVAAPISAPLNGRGMTGVAYNSTLVSIRADIDGGSDGACAFRPDDLARGLDYAVEQKARIVVLPLQGRKRLGERFEAALERAARSGAVVVIAAGNRDGDEPTWPARYAADPRFAGSIVVAGAASYYGELASWSNRAGSARPYYIAAPGEWVLTNCDRRCKLVSGTSFSTSYVAGALALVMEAHPNLSGPAAAERLLASARDAGPPGVDPIYGRGMLDLTRAFSAD